MITRLWVVMMIATKMTGITRIRVDLRSKFAVKSQRAPKRFAISWRNRWMLDRSDHVIAYVTRSWGGAAQFAELAKKRGKQVHALAPGSV